MGRFGPPLHSESVGYFGTCPTPEPAKRPTFNAVIIGAGVAFHWRGDMGLPSSSRGAPEWGQKHATGADSGCPPRLYIVPSVSRLWRRGRVHSPAFCFGESWDSSALRALWCFGTCPTLEPAKRPIFNTVIDSLNKCLTMPRCPAEFSTEIQTVLKIRKRRLGMIDARVCRHFHLMR